jgi:hypothetical protein
MANGKTPRVWLFAFGGVGWLISSVMYAFAISILLVDPPVGYGRTLPFVLIGAVSGVALQHVLCLGVGSGLMLKRWNRRARIQVTLGLAATWLVSGGWVSPYLAVLSLVPPYYMDPFTERLPLAVVALVPLASVVAACWASKTTTFRNQQQSGMAG